jgi:penicillin G amidase
VRKTFLGILLGKRLPTTSGVLRIDKLNGPVTIRRDKVGIPHIEATTDHDAWFALGFCQAQDRAFQLESTLRVCRGTLAELVGPEGLPIDKLSRRIGFFRTAKAQFEVMDANAKTSLTAFVAGINEGFKTGLPQKPHELAILGGELTPWLEADVLAFLKFTSFLLPGNWDVELARLRVLLADGPEALQAIDPLGTQVPGEKLLGAGSVVEALSQDIAAFQKHSPTGGGSNNFVIRGDRTASGKPLLANDPHLGPNVPAPWYIAHIETPEWSVAGATFAGCPAFPIGHNGTISWGVTAGLTDNTDLWLETPDAVTESLRETITVKGSADHIEDVQLTPRGPIISPLLPESPQAISLQAVWLQTLPLDGFLGVIREKSFDGFRAHFAAWPCLPLNLVYADVHGNTGYQLVGQVPKRIGSNGLIPARPDAAKWDHLVPFDEMPYLVNPAYHATANNPPAISKPWLGADFVEHYRSTILMEELAAKPQGWTLEDCRDLQKNVRSQPWAQLKDLILSLSDSAMSPTLSEALGVLKAWDGHLRADSGAATLFTLFIIEMAKYFAQKTARKSWQEMLGGAGSGLLARSLFSDRFVGPTVSRLLRDRPRDRMKLALETILRQLKTQHGPTPEWWQWGDLRQLHVTHPILGKHWLLGPIFNLPPVPVGGDANTVNQAGVRALSPFEPTHNFANLRMVFDLADWGATTVDLAGGQSGNPYSDHFEDLFQLRQRDGAAKLAWTTEEVLKATRDTLRLVP